MQAAGETVTGQRHEAMSGYPGSGAWPTSAPGSQGDSHALSHHFPALSTPVKQMEGE